MNYNEAMSYISDTYKFGHKLGLERMEWILELLGNPHKSMKYVHIAGTNGKGSVSAYMTSILMQAGYRTGTFISPCLQRFSERMTINGVEIPDEEIIRYMMLIKEKIAVIKEKSDDTPTQFEIITAMAFSYFKDNNCDIVVLEVGMGGIVDSTNIIPDSTSLASIITTIGFDHMAYLGGTLSEIAEKKAGIIKQGGSVVTYPQQPESMAVIERVCNEKNAFLRKLKNDDVHIVSETTEKTIFDFGKYNGLEIKLLGSHQPLNAALSVLAAEVLMEKGCHITEENIYTGLMSAKWPGRFEIVSTKPTVVIDGAHNMEGALSFNAGLKKYFEGKKMIFICGFSNDKDFAAMLEPFIPMAKSFIAITPDSHKPLYKETLYEHLITCHDDVSMCDDIDQALNLALKNCSQEDVICAFGSLYFIGLVRDYFGL